jgi:beta-lactamase class D
MRFIQVSCIATILALLLQACSPNNVTINNNLKPYFDSANVHGTFALYNNASGQFTIYNLKRYKDSSFLPASTFKIVNSLIGLETGIISNEKMIIPWDKKVRMLTSTDTAFMWNKDLTMQEAFQVSAVPYYQEVARRIGKDTMQRWLDSIQYGTKKITTTIDNFWLDNSLKIKPDEQLGLVKQLYFNKLPFQKRTQEVVKKVMLMDDNSNYKLSYKTGWSSNEKGNKIGWIIGWIEENRHPYFFVLNVEGNTDAKPEVRKEILMKCLASLGFLEGKM